MAHPLAVCVLFINYDHVLSVSRRNDITKWGLPGGKVDPGESAISAAVREVQEEIGFSVEPSRLMYLYRAECPGEVHYDVITYLYMGPVPSIHQLVPEAGLHVAYLPRQFLVNPDGSPFAGYNEGVFEAYNHADVSPI